MALVSLNLRPSQKQLRSFGLISLIMCPAIAALLSGLDTITLWGGAGITIAGALLFVLSRISPNLVRPVYVTLVLLTFPVGWTFSHAVMIIFYYGIITPIALLFRLMRRDPLCRQYDATGKTYWLQRRRRRSMKDYFRQF